MRDPMQTMLRTIRRGNQPTIEPTEQVCPTCSTDIGDSDLWQDLRVCPHCGHHARRSARAVIASLADARSFRERDTRLVSRDPLQFEDEQPYADRLASLRRDTGERDAIITGTMTIDGHRVSVAVLDFSFLGGSMGVVVGEKIARAADRAVRSQIPLLTIVSSGGARMQEGMLSLLQMAKTASAIARLQAHGVPYVSVLTNPTTGGVFASFANLGDVVIAEPKALIGFAGPRVAEQAMGSPLPPGTHSSEFLLDHGMIDDIVPRPELRDYLVRLLRVWTADRSATRLDTHESAPGVLGSRAGSAWDAVQAARDTRRPTSMDYLGRIITDFTETHGDRVSGDDPAVVTGYGMLGNRAVAIVAQERGHEDDRRRGGRGRPAGYRKAQRIMESAARLGLPVVSLIDTPGAYPGVESEEGGLAAELASSMAMMSQLPTPTVALVIGEGGSGGALALGVADRVLMLEHAIYSVIAPEGAATILYRDASRAPELSERLRITADELLDLGLVDAIVPEPPGGAASDYDAAACYAMDAITAALAQLSGQQSKSLLKARWSRYQRIGSDHTRNEPRVNMRRLRQRRPLPDGVPIPEVVGRIARRVKRPGQEPGNA